MSDMLSPASAAKQKPVAEELDRVRIQVIEAKDLISADSNGFSDPFATVVLNTVKRDTNVIYKNLNPHWDNEIFDFKVEDPKMDVIQVVMWDKDRIGKDFLGQCLIPVSVVAYKAEPVQIWVPLRPRVTEKKKMGTLRKGARDPSDLGQVHLELTYLVATAAPSLQRGQSQAQHREVLTRSAVNTFRRKADTLTSTSGGWEVPHEDINKGEMLAEGVNACVFRGEYRGQAVAIKVLKHALDPVQMKDFTMEFEMLSRLKSPWAVLFYGASIDEATSKLSMIFELCANGSLTGVMQRDDIVFDWDKVFKFGIQMTSGIASLHNWTPPIVHRDIKSLNFLVDAFYNIKVADLGLARTTEDTNDETLKSLRGTYHYSPPESYGKEQTYDAKSDVFSLAVCLWELVARAMTGAYVIPYKEHDFKFDFQIIIKVSKEGLRPTIPEGCPPMLRELITVCWDTDKNARLTSIQLVEALHKLLVIYKQNRAEWDALISDSRRTSVEL